MKSEIKVYVGCSLTHAPEEFRQKVEKLKEKLSTICHVLYFKGLVGEIPYKIYQWDIKECVYQCDIMVAVCDYPSIGLGIEMGTQMEARQKPVLAVAHKDSKVTDLIHDPRTPGFIFYRYENFVEDVYNLVLQEIKRIELMS
jgi:nucleoside 2-deoxyribosyltransferase